MEEFLNWLLPILRDVGLKLLSSIIVFIVGRLLIRALIRILRNGKAMQKTEPTVAHFLCNFVNIGLYMLLAVTIIAIMGIPMASLVAAIASAGVAIGLALQGALGNFAGGIMILLFHPFRVGDYIEVSDFSGTVKDIDVFYTQLHTPDNRIVTVPNGNVIGSAVINYSSNGTRRVELVFNVAYGSDVERIKSLLTEVATAHGQVLPEPAAFCRLTEEGESALKFTLRVWTRTEDYWPVRFDLLESVHKRLEIEGIQIPFPQLDVHISK